MHVPSEGESEKMRKESGVFSPITNRTRLPTLFFSSRRQARPTAWPGRGVRLGHSSCWSPTRCGDAGFGGRTRLEGLDLIMEGTPKLGSRRLLFVPTAKPQAAFYFPLSASFTSLSTTALRCGPSTLAYRYTPFASITSTVGNPPTNHARVRGPLLPS
jgi:hypothetical protein